MQEKSRKAREFRRREQGTLDTIPELFLEQGEDSIAVEMVANAVDIGKGAIYKHFRSKAKIYLRLMLDYERDLVALFHSEDVARDKETLSRTYFGSHMHSPQRYRLFDRLEEKVAKTSQAPETVEELHKIYASGFERLIQLIKERTVDGKLENVPLYFYYCAAQALVHSAMALYHLPFRREVLEGQEGFFHFLVDIGVCMGDKRKREGDAPSA